MTATLLRKEWQQHRLSFLLLALLTFATASLIAAANHARGQTGSLFDAQLAVLRLILPLAAWVLGQRLVTHEFREKTQLFLEALPLPRWLMIAVKYAAGLTVAFFLTLTTLAALAAFGWRSEHLTPRFLGILTARTAAWTWCAFTFFFLTGFFGRYRLLFLLGLVVLYVLVDRFTEFRPAEFGPFALIDGRFPYENLVFPLTALLSTTLLTLGLLALVFVLGVARDGTIGARLGERMAQSEKLFLGAICLAGLTTFGVFGLRKERTPFDLPGATEESRGEVVVKVAVTQESERARGAAIGARAADELAALRSYLGVDSLPAVFIVLRSDFGAAQYERVKLEKSDDLVIRANFTAEKFVDRDFLDFLIRDLLLLRSRERLSIENQVWVLDGFAELWKERAGAANADKLRATASRTAGTGFSRAEFRAWRRFSKRVGKESARAIAWSALHSLTRHHGEDATRDFLRSVLSPVAAHDARATVRDLWQPVPSRLAAAAGVSFDQFFAEWQQDLRTP